MFQRLNLSCPPTRDTETESRASSLAGAGLLPCLFRAYFKAGRKLSTLSPQLFGSTSCSPTGTSTVACRCSEAVVRLFFAKLICMCTWPFWPGFEGIIGFANRRSLLIMGLKHYPQSTGCSLSVAEHVLSCPAPPPPPPRRPLPFCADSGP